MEVPRTMRRLAIMMLVCSAVTIGGFVFDYIRKGPAVASAPMVFLGGFLAGTLFASGAELLAFRKTL
jgi:hypothetical protein